MLLTKMGQETADASALGRRERHRRLRSCHPDHKLTLIRHHVVFVLGLLGLGWLRA